MKRWFAGMLMLTVAGCATVEAGQGPKKTTSTRADAVEVPASRWKQVLEPLEYNVLREQGTERAFSGDLWDHHGDGVFTCAGCGLPLFDSETKFESGTGWPSYTAPIATDAVGETVDRAYGMVRTEVHCNRCGGHLGHVFPDGPAPTGLRYCINAASLDFLSRLEAQKLPENPPVKLGGLDGEVMQ